ncbi:hypothetical protein [Nodosilinea sp. E11]|uniref:hypothetical protein n=1 Tax=Nodosilinea sp. E11 TaxID=3037479 RepID=UPI00293457A1|nr:hypothetical protein [Nodosilinea sp. E11]WOD41280.1 hypothetical protein RRF56_10790 [Nodosilinea sp. E11]
MRFQTLQSLSLGVVALLVTSAVAIAPARAQDIRPLSENASLIRACRQLNRTSEVFDNSTLGPPANRIGTLAVGTQVTLTGAITTGRAQVYLSNDSLSGVQPVGWLNAGNLAPCGTTPPPIAGACFRANQALNVRSTPSTTAPIEANFLTNDLIRATTNPPTQQTTGDGRQWMQVGIFNGDSGWIARTGANGIGSNVTPTTCP